VRTLGAVILFLAVPQLHAFSLRSEALAFLSRLSAQGYPGTGMTLLELNLMEPCTVSIYPPAGSPPGFVIGMGGNNMLDMHLRLEGNGWSLDDSLPDDLPVLRLDSAEASGIIYAIVCVRDMIRGSMTDSAAVIWAFAPVEPTGGWVQLINPEDLGIPGPARRRNGDTP
jgi:hypothetical protein